MTVQIPVVNEGERYLNGFHFTFITASTISVTEGQCRDSTNVNDMNLGVETVVDFGVVGVNGLDEGVIAIKTVYTVHAIGDSTKYEPTALLLSTSLTAPLLPAGYDMFRAIGHLTTDPAAATLLRFEQTGNGLTRRMWFEAAQNVASGGPIIYTVISLLGVIPTASGVKQVNLLPNVTPTLAGEGVAYRPAGGATTQVDSSFRLSGSVAGVSHQSLLELPTSASGSIEYSMDAGGGTVLTQVTGYVDVL
jgi:hypothetical protein